MLIFIATVLSVCHSQHKLTVELTDYTYQRNRHYQNLFACMCNYQPLATDKEHTSNGLPRLEKLRCFLRSQYRSNRSFSESRVMEGQTSRLRMQDLTIRWQQCRVFVLVSPPPHKVNSCHADLTNLIVETDQNRCVKFETQIYALDQSSQLKKILNFSKAAHITLC